MVSVFFVWKSRHFFEIYFIKNHKPINAKIPKINAKNVSSMDNMFYIMKLKINIIVDIE